MLHYLQNLDGFHFPNTFKALQVSYSVMTCNPNTDHSTSKNFSAILCLSSVPNRTCAGSGPKKIKDSPTSQAVLTILVSHWLRTRKIGNSPLYKDAPKIPASPFFSLTCMASFAEFAFKCTELPKNSGPRKSRILLHKQVFKTPV